MDIRGMTIDEAIKHAEEVAEEKEAQAWEAQLQEEYRTIKPCKECAAEHRQLAEWLKDYKRLKEQLKGHGRLIDADALIEQIKKSRCIDCNSYNGVRCRACQYDDEMADIDAASTIIEADKGSGTDV